MPMKQQKKMWRLFEHGPSLSLPSDIERDWLNQFDHSPHKIVTLPPSSTIASNDQRVACMTASKIITLHHASIDDAGIALTTPDQTIKVSCPVSALAMGYAHRFTSPAATAKLTPVVASGHTNGDIYLWNGETSRMMTRLVSHTNTVTQILFSPPANCKKRLMTQIISVSTDRKAKVWDFEDNGYNMSQTISFPSAMHCCAWSSQGGLTAFGGASRKVYIHRKVNHKISKEMVLKLSGHLHNVVSLKFWPDGALLVSASWDARIHIWDSYTGQLKQILSFYHPLPQLLFPSQVRCIDISRFGNALVSVSDVGAICLWDPMSKSLFTDGKCQTLLNTTPEELLHFGEEKTCRSCSFIGSDNHLVVSNFTTRTIKAFAVKLPLPSLKHLCRLVVRNSVHDPSLLDNLGLPTRLISFLRYDDWL